MGIWGFTPTNQEKPDPPKTPESKSIFHDKPNVFRQDIVRKLKSYFKNNASKYGLPSSYASEIEELLPSDLGGIINEGAMQTAIHRQEQNINDMPLDPKQRAIGTAKLRLLKDFTNQH